MARKIKVLPNPGSKEAVKIGCTCAVLDNHYGAGIYGGRGGTFWVSASCPLHGDVRSKIVSEEGN